MTFIDIESVLKIVRDISEKVLSIIGLFFGIVFLFALGAIMSFFTRMRPIEAMKERLYSLFGARKSDITTTLLLTRGTLFAVSYLASVLLAGILSYFVLTSGSFFTFSLTDFLMLSGVTALIYIVMAGVMRR